MDGGFAQSHLWLSADLDAVEEWNEAVIVDRAGRLMERAVQVWTEPPAQYIQSMDMVGGVSTGGDAIDGYEFLGRGGATRTLFESFRVLVRGLDPCVTEDFLKHYIAYKAETNFVDVVAQANGLQLTLNMSFADLDDPRGLALDVTGVGRWGNGDVAVRLTELDLLPYVVSLVRQSLERQMADWDSSPSEAPVFVDDLEIAD